MSRLHLIASRTSLLLLCACGGSSTRPSDPPAGTLSLTAANTTLVPGLATQLTWVVKDAQGQTVTDLPVTFSATPAGIVSVDADGRVLGLTTGTATISGKTGRAAAQVTVAVQEGGVVGPDGGVVRFQGGVVELEVPAGAAPTPIVIRISQGSNPLLDPTADRSRTYEINTGARAFTTAVTLRMLFDPTKGPYGLPADEYRIRFFTGTAWEGAANGASDGSAVLSAAITAGGLYSVGWAAPEQPCTAAEYRQFDFWIGAWSITAFGLPNGQSDITAAPGGCAILEHYRSLGGDVGRSISFYRPETGLWYQTYIDSNGGQALISGSRQGDTMSLYTQLFGNTLLRTTFTRQLDGSVRHQSARSTDAGNSYEPPYWDGIYTPR